MMLLEDSVQMNQVKYHIRSQLDPCLYFVWRDGRLTLMVSWVDVLLLFGESADV